MPKYLHVFLAIVLVSLVGCADVQIQPPCLIVLVVDRTESNKYLDKAVNMITPKDQDIFFENGILGKLPPKSVVAVMTITNHARAEDTIVEPTKIAYSEFDPTVAAKDRKTVMDKVRAIDYLRNQPGTDIMGALFRASLILNESQYRDYEKHLLLFTDLAENLNRNFQAPNLAETDVLVVNFSPDLEPEMPDIDKPNQDAWQDKFQTWGAKSVEVKDVDNSNNIDWTSVFGPSN